MLRSAAPDDEPLSGAAGADGGTDEGDAIGTLASHAGSGACNGGAFASLVAARGMIIIVFFLPYKLFFSSSFPCCYY